MGTGKNKKGKIREFGGGQRCGRKCNLSEAFGDCTGI